MRRGRAAPGAWAGNPAPCVLRFALCTLCNTAVVRRAKIVNTRGNCGGTAACTQPGLEVRLLWRVRACEQSPVLPRSGGRWPLARAPQLGCVTTLVFTLQPRPSPRLGTGHLHWSSQRAAAASVHQQQQNTEYLLMLVPAGDQPPDRLR